MVFSGLGLLRLHDNRAGGVIYGAGAKTNASYQAYSYPASLSLHESYVKLKFDFNYVLEAPGSDYSQIRIDTTMLNIGCVACWQAHFG